ncbi:MAG: cobalamin-dependent protein, partial [Planctomycetes bacterium]|nr:cobalamin-dependent protein [Planctomycetota bacterium]
MKVLLTSVFGPYGVDDAYGRKENVMELFHNQVTREQGLFSLRFNHQSFGLHFIADNLNAPTKVLDFPTEARFVREIQKGYDVVGISFILPNFLKAKRMAELVREHAPASRIVLGGHGTALPGIEKMIPCDDVCRGEGVLWMRRYLGEETD